jgi:hypothetical protein
VLLEAVLEFSWLSRKFLEDLHLLRIHANTNHSIIYGYFEIAAKEGDMAGLKGMMTA